MFKGPLSGTSVDDKPHDRSVTPNDAFVEGKLLPKLRGTPATYKSPPITLTPLIVGSALDPRNSMRLSAYADLLSFQYSTNALSSFCRPSSSSSASASLTAPSCSLSGMTGTPTSGEACRYTIKYAEVTERWGHSAITPAFE